MFLSNPFRSSYVLPLLLLITTAVKFKSDVIVFFFHWRCPWRAIGNRNYKQNIQETTLNPPFFETVGSLEYNLPLYMYFNKLPKSMKQI